MIQLLAYAYGSGSFIEGFFVGRRVPSYSTAPFLVDTITVFQYCC